MKRVRLDHIEACDCVAGMRRLPDACVDLVFTSPPYADLRDYARIRPDDYVGWFLPAAYEVKRLLKSRGSFVLNLNDRCVRGARHLYVFKLVVALVEIVGFRLVETYIWHKPNPMPGRYGPRPKDAFEYVFWFGKSTDVKFNLESVGVPVGHKSAGQETRRPGKRQSGRSPRPRVAGLPTRHNPRVKRRLSGRPMKDTCGFTRGWADPGNVLRLPVSVKPGNHPAVMPAELAEFFIKLATDRGDVVLDPFMGSGTTARAARKLGRRYLGFEIHRRYVDIG